MVFFYPAGGLDDLSKSASDNKIVNPHSTSSKYLYLLMFLKLRFLEELIKNKMKEKPSCPLDKLKVV